MLSIKNLSKSFGDKKILDSVNLDVRRGEIAVLLGASGVGKSTLLRVLNNLEVADTGEIKLDGELIDLSTINQRHLSGMVFQQFNLFEHLTAEQNIRMGLERGAGFPSREAQEVAQRLLREYGLADKAKSYVSQLSGGQKQRLAIARALALRPQIICLDEPTSALDPLLTNYVAEMIQALARQSYIVLVATHDTTLLERLSCTIYLMSNGKIIESALSKEFYAHKENFPQIARFVSGQK
ncbi:ATP-binding cassette domain-containing protein [Candidatus Dependentiae bacterium]|nr:ATP-binding cassette domain-containing protein [Candidatus Dependentiae bacterium]